MRLLISIALIAFAVGCSSAPLSPPRPVDSLKVLNGSWRGTVSSSLGTSPYEWVVKDGQYSSFVGAPLNLTTPGEIRLDGGRTVFESERSIGTVTLHEREGRRLIRLEGKNKSGQPDFTAEMAEVK